MVAKRLSAIQKRKDWPTTKKSTEAIADDNRRNSDGPLVCGRCGTPKEVRLSTELPDGHTAIVPIPYECMKRAEAERHEREPTAERKCKIERTRTECFVGYALSCGCIFDADGGRAPQVTAIYKGYADMFSRDDMNGLFLWGKVGTGKSFYASTITNRVIDLGLSASQTSVQDVVAHIGLVPFNEHENAKSRLLKYDLLVIDGLGMHRNTDYVMGHVYDIIDSRHKNRRPMVVVTNLDPNIAMKSGTDDAPWPRIFTHILERCAPAKLASENRHEYKMTEMREAMRKRLGM